MEIKYNIVHAFGGCSMLYCRYLVFFWYLVGVLLFVTVPPVQVGRAYPDIFENRVLRTIFLPKRYGGDRGVEKTA